MLYVRQTKIKKIQKIKNERVDKGISDTPSGPYTNSERTHHGAVSRRQGQRQGRVG